MYSNYSTVYFTYCTVLSTEIPYNLTIATVCTYANQHSYLQIYLCFIYCNYILYNWTIDTDVQYEHKQPIYRSISVLHTLIMFNYVHIDFEEQYTYTNERKQPHSYQQIYLCFMYVIGNKGTTKT